MSKESRRSAYAKTDDPNFYDYIVKPKIKGRLLNRRILMILFYILFVGGFCSLCIAFKLIPVMCLVLVLSCIIVYFTWRYVSPEYVYSFNGPNINFAIIYGGITRKDLFEFHIKDLEKVAPYTDKYKDEADAVTDAEKFYQVSSMDAYDIYYILGTAKDGKRRLVFFEATEESKKRLRYYKEDAVILK